MSSAHAAWKDRLTAAVTYHGAAAAQSKTLSKKRSMLGSFANMLGALSEQEALLNPEESGAPALPPAPQVGAQRVSYLNYFEVPLHFV